jgi:predicted RNA-binding protein with PUA-like domain
MAKQYWLVKSEPADYSFEQFKKDGKIGWTGVRNYQARNFMRDGMKLGDRVFFYHSSTEPQAIMGVAEVSHESHPDPTQFEPTSDYYDAKSTNEKPTWMMVELKFVEAFKRPVTREELKKTKSLEKMELFRLGRISITPVTEAEFNVICALGR